MHGNVQNILISPHHYYENEKYLICILYFLMMHIGKKPLQIHFTYLGDKDIHCIFKT